MKKLLTITACLLFAVTLGAPALFAQEAPEVPAAEDSRNSGNSRGFMNFLEAAGRVFSQGFPAPFGGKNRKERKFEIALLDTSIGFSNTFLNQEDIFGPDKNLEIDLNKLGSQGIILNLNGLIEPLGVKFQIGKLSFDISSEESFSFTADAKDSFTKMLLQGNGSKITGLGDLPSAMSGELVLSGAAFADLGVKVGYPFMVLGRELKVSARPAVYAPIFYIKESTLTPTWITTADGMYIALKGNFDMYAPAINGGDTELAFGFDISTVGEWKLFPTLDIGIGISHIPLVPAMLNRYRGSIKGDLLSMSDMLGAQNITFGEDMEITYDADGKGAVFRPLRFDLFTPWRPFGVSKILVVKPNIGFSVLTQYKDPCFNTGLELQFNLPWILSLTAYSYLQEKIWHQGMGFVLDFRVFELDMGMDMQAPDYAASWSGKGMGVNLALRFGW
jgi:hypothetical protein